MLKKLIGTKVFKTKFFRKKGLIHLMPEIYFRVMKKKDFSEHETFLNKILDPNNRLKSYHQKGDHDEFAFYNYSPKKLKNKILKFVSETKNDVLLYRIFPNKTHDFILASFYEKIDKDDECFTAPSISDFNKIFLYRKNRLLRHVDVKYFLDKRKKTTMVTIKCVNVAHNTLISNIFETLNRHNVVPDYIQVWQISRNHKRIKSCYEVLIELDFMMNEIEQLSMKEDFVRYIQLYIKSMSIFDLVGPAMVGPSSSHTAGANRIGQIARNIICATIASGENIKDLDIKLIGSFRDTGVGHKTPSALGGGLCGCDTDDPAMIKLGDVDFLKKNGINFGGQIAKFNGFKKGRLSDDEFYSNQKSSNIAEISFRTDKGTHTITGFSIGAGNVEIRFFDYWLDFPINGKFDTVLHDGKIERVDDTNSMCPKISKIYHENTALEHPIMPFHTFEELIAYVNKKKIDIVDLILDIENQLQNSDKKQIYDKMRDYRHTMQKSVNEGIKSKKLSFMKLSGKDSNTINNYRKTHKTFDNIYGKAVAYAVAVNEINAKSGTIIACPTAGSCGILPGVLKAYTEVRKVKEDKILQALMVAGFFGMILFDDVSTAGADYGCQAEIGSAAGMAACALVYLEGGTVEQMVQGFIIAIKNSLGLICDPVAGLVEVPCVKRNGLYSSHAISSALMALSGVKSFISPDEVVLTMREVGTRLNADYRETSRGGLAKTRDGKAVEKNFATEVDRFFE